MLRTIISIPISFFIYVILSRVIAGALAGLYQVGSERIGVIVAFVLLFIFCFAAGYFGGFICRERIAPILAGIGAAIYILSVNDQTLISKAIFYAPYANLGTDEVLLGLAIVLFTFLWGGKLGEQSGFRRDRSHLLPDGV